MKHATKKAKAEATAPHSEIIEQCTIYAQSTAAYKGGFYTDPTGDFDYAGSKHGKRSYLAKAKRALKKLTALSREKQPITTAELFAEAKVAKLLMKLAVQTQPEPEESAFVRRFVKDATRHLEQALKNDADR
jgi:hypothetical protein